MILGEKSYIATHCTFYPWSSGNLSHEPINNEFHKSLTIRISLEYFHLISLYFLKILSITLKKFSMLSLFTFSLSIIKIPVLYTVGL